MTAGGSRRRERRRIALRSTLLQSAWNYETLQGTGFGWSLLPALERLYPDPAARARRLHEHLGVFNSNPYLASLAMGVAVRIEEEIARGEAAAARERLARLLKALRGTLGAVGDELFWVACRPALGLAAAVAVLLGAGPWGGIAFLIAYNAVAQGVRWAGVPLGFASGAGIARVLQSPFWHRTIARARVLGGLAAGAALGAAVAAAALDGGLAGAGVSFALVALLWLAGLRFGSRRRPLSPALAFLALVILLGALTHLRPGALPW